MERIENLSVEESKVSAGDIDREVAEINRVIQSQKTAGSARVCL